jgi:PAS domain-containing protein
MVGEASQALRFNQRVLEAALENMSQGISVVDRDLRLVAWNRRYAELFGYPPGICCGSGMPVQELRTLGARVAMPAMPPATIDAAVAKRLVHMKCRQRASERARFPGRERRRNPRQPDARRGLRRHLHRRHRVPPAPSRN